MSRKSVLALAAIVALGTVALAATEASARGHGGGGGGFSRGGFHGGSFRAVSRVGFRSSFRSIRHVRPHWHHHHRHHWWAWRRPYWVAPVIAGGVATTYAAAPTYNRCTCLIKEYTQEGAVVFKDLCTKEMAMNPPADVGPAAGPGPASYQQPPQGMAPQQTYAMPPQTYAAPQQPYAAPQGQPYPQYR